MKLVKPIASQFNIIQHWIKKKFSLIQNHDLTCDIISGKNRDWFDTLSNYMNYKAISPNNEHRCHANCILHEFLP